MPKESIVWTFFDKLNENTRDKTKCKLCGHCAPYHKNTTNLKDHLKRKHPLQLSELEQQLRPQDNVQIPKVEPNVEVTTEEEVLPLPSKRQCQLQLYAATQKEIDSVSFDRGLLKMIVQDYQPLSLVENKGFINFVNLLQPCYNLPSCKKVSETLLLQEYESALNNLKVILANISHLSITTDMWTSDSNKCYITVTGHFIYDFKLKSCVLGTEEIISNHSSQNISDNIINILSKFPGCLEKISVVVTDNGNNMEKAVTDYLKKNHHPCVAHTLNLSVLEAITNCSNLNAILNKCRALYTYFKNSNVATCKLRETQANMNLPVTKLKKDMPTRWNTILIMLERFSEVRNPLSATLISLMYAPENLKVLEWAAIDDIIPLLKPIHKMAEELCGEDYQIISKVIPLIRGMQYILLQKRQSTDIGMQLKRSLCDIIGRTLGSLEAHKSVALCTLLDPRFKKAGFGLPENAANTQKWLVEQLAAEMNEQGGQYVTNRKNTAIETNQQNMNINDDIDDLWKVFDHKVLSEIAEKTSKTPTSSASLTVKQYIEMPLIHRKEDPFIFWKTHHRTFATLHQLAFKYLCIPATSVPSERVFSKAGYLINQRRSRLAPKHLNEIIFLNKNMDMFY